MDGTASTGSTIVHKFDIVKGRDTLPHAAKKDGKVNMPRRPECTDHRVIACQAVTAGGRRRLTSSMMRMIAQASRM
jgi:hypothetical protein